MVIFESVAALIIIFVILLLDVAKELVAGTLAKILAVVNIALHIVLIFPLMQAAVPMSEAVLVYMCSTFVYTLSFFVRHSIEERRARREEDCDL